MDEAGTAERGLIGTRTHEGGLAIVSDPQELDRVRLPPSRLATPAK